MRIRTGSPAARKDTLMDAKNWIAIGAASALGLGVMAAGAVSTASALPLIAGATNLEVPGITVPSDVKGTASTLDFSVTSESIVTPEPSSSPSPEPTPSDSPASVVSVASPVTPDSPASPVSVDSAASAASVASVGSSD